METIQIVTVTRSAKGECFGIQQLEIKEVNLLANTGSILTQNLVVSLLRSIVTLVKYKNNPNVHTDYSVWQEKQDAQRTIQKDLHNPDNHDGVITHLEPDILECKIK